MDALTKDELGFVRARKFGRVSRKEMDDLLGTKSDEQVYKAGVDKGVRTAKPLDPSDDIELRPGDTFTVGPRITKAANNLPEQIRKEADALQRSGFGSVDRPIKTEGYWKIRLKSLTLPGGIRTDALVLLPLNYPLASPIGFYVHEGAATGSLDTTHLFDGAYHGAPDLSGDGWQWFCGIAQGWKPGRHTLVTYLSLVLSLFNEED